MRNVVIITAALLALASFAPQAKATLTLSFNGVSVFDDNSDLFWFSDLSAFNFMTFEQQLDAIAALGNARFATTEEMETLVANPVSEIALVFVPNVLSSIGPDQLVLVWTGVYLDVLVEPLEEQRRAFNFRLDINSGEFTVGAPLGSTIGPTSPFDFVGAWVVATEPISLVPEPSTLLLLGFGLARLLGSAWSRHRRR